MTIRTTGRGRVASPAPRRRTASWGRRRPHPGSDPRRARRAPGSGFPSAAPCPCRRAAAGPRPAPSPAAPRHARGRRCRRRGQRGDRGRAELRAATIRRSATRRPDPPRGTTAAARWARSARPPRLVPRAADVGTRRGRTRHRSATCRDQVRAGWCRRRARRCSLSSAGSSSPAPIAPPRRSAATTDVRPLGPRASAGCDAMARRARAVPRAGSAARPGPPLGETGRR